jgi:hypothetical protein
MYHELLNKTSPPSVKFFVPQTKVKYWGLKTGAALQPATMKMSAA